MKALWVSEHGLVKRGLTNRVLDGGNLQLADDDFSAAKYTAAGTYLKFRFAFDHMTSREAMAWWEKRSQ